MRVKRITFALSFLLGASLSLSCGNDPRSATSSGEVLYVIDNGSAATYSIDPRSLAATPVEQETTLVPSSAFLFQFAPAPDDAFLYGVWTDAQNQQHLSVFETDLSGVPQIPAIQELKANSLSQFNMHPSGRFAYMLEVTTSNNLYWSDIRLFNVKSGGGTLEENPQVQGSYGPASSLPAFLYGFSPDGSKLYDTSLLLTDSLYRQRSINRTTGALGNDAQLLSVSNEAEVVIGSVIVDQYQSDTDTTQNYLDIFPNIPNTTQPIIHCTITMLSSCATATNVQLDPSGHYLFLTDPTTQAVHVAALNLSEKTIHDTGSSIPMTSQTPGFAFSPDGNIVYAMLASDRALHFYHFDSSSGSVNEAGTPIPLAPGSGICPALRQLN